MNQQELPASSGSILHFLAPGNAFYEHIETDKNAVFTGPGAGRPPNYHVFDPDALVLAPEVYYAGFLEAGDMGVWLGREKSRKSSAILQFAFCAALGEPFFGIPFAYSGPLKVTIFDYESKIASMSNRYNALADAMGLDKEKREALKENLKVVLFREMAAAGGTIPRFTKGSNEDADEYWARAVRDNKADVYIIDPFRNSHAENENDSEIEALLAKMRKIFGKASVIIAHHMVKRNKNPKDNVGLMEDMRLFSDGGRGSSAIKGYCDLIVSQEWFDKDGEEVIHWGAFGKNIPDLHPLALCQTQPNSCLWVPTNIEKLSSTERASLTALQEHHPNLIFASKAQAAELIKSTRGVARSTANVHVDRLFAQGLITIDLLPGRQQSLSLRNPLAAA